MSIRQSFKLRSFRLFRLSRLFLQLENSGATADKKPRDCEDDGVSKKFRVASRKRRATNSSRGRVYVFTWRAALSRVITFRGSLTPDNYLAVVVNFPGNKRRRPLRRRRRHRRNTWRQPGGDDTNLTISAGHKDDPFSRGWLFGTTAGCLCRGATTTTTRPAAAASQPPRLIIFWALKSCRS